MTPHYLEMEHDPDLGFKMGVYLCLGQTIHAVQIEDAIPISKYKSFAEIQERIQTNDKLFVFMGEGQHKIKRKAEQIACKDGGSLSVCQILINGLRIIMRYAVKILKFNQDLTNSLLCVNHSEALKFTF